MVHETATASKLPQSIEDITDAWLTSALNERFPGAQVGSVHFGTIIAGTATKVRLLLEYNVEGHRHRLPPTMWLKGGFIRHNHTYDQSFVSEARFFQDWASELDINIPQSYYAGYEEGVQGLVLLEDLCARNVSFGRATSPITPDQQAQTLGILAKLHARWWDSPKTSSLDSFSTHWAAADRVVMRMLEEDYFNSCMGMPRCSGIVEAYRDRDRVKAGLRKQWERSTEIPQCFVHGDAHLGNMFFEHDGTPGFLDWQSYQEGPYMHDVAYSIIGNLSTEDRRAHERDLIAVYLKALEDAGIKTVPAWDDAWQAYRRHAMHGFMWAFTPVEMQPEDICEAEGQAFGAAVSDLDTFGALGV